MDERLSNTLNEIKDISSRMQKFEDGRIDKVGYENFRSDHETRMRRLEKWGAMAIGGLTIIQIIVIMLGHFLK